MGCFTISSSISGICQEDALWVFFLLETVVSLECFDTAIHTCLQLLVMELFTNPIVSQSLAISTIYVSFNHWLFAYQDHKLLQWMWLTHRVWTIFASDLHRQRWISEYVPITLRADWSLTTATYETRGGQPVGRLHWIKTRKQSSTAADR